MKSRASGPSRGITIGGGAIAVAGLAVALTLYSRDFTPRLWMLCAVGALAIAFVAFNALPIRGLRRRRSGRAAEAVFLDVPIAAPLVLLHGAAGPTAAAVALAAGFGIAAIARRGSAPTDIARHGVLRTLAALAFIPLALHFGPVLWAKGLSAQLAFAFALAVVVTIFIFTLSAFTSAVVYRIGLARVWQRLVRDPRTWIVGISNVLWAAAVRDPIVSGHMTLAMVMWAPVIGTSVLLRTIDEQTAELHRLRLVRDAVKAMLGDRDPLPQINAILATLRVPSPDETVTVLAATSSRVESWRTVTLLGPVLSPAGDELRRRLLVRMKFSGTASITLHDQYYAAYAFAAQLSDGDLNGALIVHRRHDRPLSGEQMAQFANAARELAPLLGDMRSIAAAQSAATIDGLTALYNRAATLERLESMLADMAIPDRGAVLLLDIDHFKTINDQLGHAAGDDCLRRIGNIIRGTVRGGDTPGRIGGEEFLVVMPGATRDVAMTVGERLRLAVALGGMRYANGDPVTASIGIATANVGETGESLLARSDRALYEAKRQGRNRIVEDVEETG
ncbi:MAG: GGDEF domain-containing protein [Vulcanimicrobiaceae bacterium]